jgi:hypothetical protein
MTRRVGKRSKAERTRRGKEKKKKEGKKKRKLVEMVA